MHLQGCSEHLRHSNLVVSALQLRSHRLCIVRCLSTLVVGTALQLVGSLHLDTTDNPLGHRFSKDLQTQYSVG